ncbi:MAG TPA: sialidase family protein [Nitrososphaera sp.]|nr:sialidase family protein [Nitrososphaera sp.]
MRVPYGKRIASISLSVLLFVSILVIISNPSYANAEVQTRNTTSSSAPEVGAASGSNRFLVWEDSTPGNWEIFFRRSTDNGATWKPTVNLSNNPGPSQVPLIAVSGSHVYVVWRQANTEGLLPNIFFIHSADNGATWGPKIKISSSGSVQIPSYDLAALGGNVYVIWQDSSGTLFRRSTDNGATWKQAIPLCACGGSDHQLAVSGVNVYGTWKVGTDILVIRSTDSGASWKPLKYLTNNDGFGQVGAPSIAVSGSNAYVVWHDRIQGNYEIFIRRSTDNGATWKPLVNLSNNPEWSAFPQIAASGFNVYVVWADEIVQIPKAHFSEADIFLRRSTDGGVTWKPRVELVDNQPPSLNPHIAVSSSNVYVVWEQRSDSTDSALHDVFFRRSADNGATWKPLKNLSSDGKSIDPQIFASGSSVYGVWIAEATPSNYDVFLRRSIDNGATWESAKNLSDNAGGSSRPSLGV